MQRSGLLRLYISFLIKLISICFNSSSPDQADSTAGTTPRRTEAAEQTAKRTVDLGPTEPGRFAAKLGKLVAEQGTADIDFHRCSFIVAGRHITTADTAPVGTATADIEEVALRRGRFGLATHSCSLLVALGSGRLDQSQEPFEFKDKLEVRRVNLAQKSQKHFESSTTAPLSTNQDTEQSASSYTQRSCTFHRKDHSRRRKGHIESCCSLATLHSLKRLGCILECSSSMLLTQHES